MTLILKGRARQVFAILRRMAHPPVTKVWRNEAGVLEEYRVGKP